MSAGMMQAIVDSIDTLRYGKIISLETRLESQLRLAMQGTPKYFAAAPTKYIQNMLPTDTPAPRRDADAQRLREAMHRGMQSEQPGQDSAARVAAGTSDSAEVVRKVLVAPLDSVGAAYRALTDARQLQAQALADLSGIDFDGKQMDRFLVEIYKKYSIPVACLVFVLIGAPLGMMARRGGFGVGAGLSLGFFLFYWACLIGGEKLADRGELSPFWGMWVANIILGIMGILLTVRSARESRVIDWSFFSRFVPKSLRAQAGADTVNPHEA
jgi:hypothetical protein